MSRKTLLPPAPSRRLFLLAAGLCLMLAACCPGHQAPPTPADPPAAAMPLGAETPEGAVQALLQRLAHNQLPELAHVALPPPLHQGMEAAWREGRSRWPLTELPLDDNIPKLLAALNQPLAEETLRRGFRRQLAGQTPALQDAAYNMALFGKEYLRREGRYSEQDRQHYVQVLRVLGQWARQAPLGDAERGHQGIRLLVEAAGQSAAKRDEDFSRLGMDESLRQLVPLLVAMKRLFALYGLDLDAALASTQVRTLSQQGSHAEVELRYELAGQSITTVMVVEQVDGRWYLADYLRAAREVQGVAPAPAAAGTAAAAQAPGAQVPPPGGHTSAEAE